MEPAVWLPNVNVVAEPPFRWLFLESPINYLGGGRSAAPQGDTGSFSMLMGMQSGPQPPTGGEHFMLILGLEYAASLLAVSRCSVSELLSQYHCHKDPKVVSTNLKEVWNIIPLKI